MDEGVEILLNRCFSDDAMEINPGRVLSDSEESALTRQLLLWDVGLHGLLKIFDKSYKIPAKQNIIRATKPRTEYLHALFELCSGVHSRQKMETPVPYANGADWFAAIYQEIRLQASAELLYSKPMTKEDEVKALRANTAALRDHTNPVPAILRSHWLLLEMARDIAEWDVRFKNQYYRAFIKAYQAHVDELKTGKWKQVKLQKGDAYLKISGRHVKRIHPGSHLNFIDY